MIHHDLHFAGQRFQARASGALFWPARRWLILSDLHLGKSERMARRGGALLPPYETQETLDRAASEIEATDPAAIVSLGDGFDDDAAGRALPDDICARLQAMAQGRDWIWVQGNHDPGPHLPAPSGRRGRADRRRSRPAPRGRERPGHQRALPPLHPAGRHAQALLPAGRDAPDPARLRGLYRGPAGRGSGPAALVPKGIAIACGSRALPVPVGHRTRRRA